MPSVLADLFREHGLIAEDSYGYDSAPAHCVAGIDYALGTMTAGVWLGKPNPVTHFRHSTAC